MIFTIKNLTNATIALPSPVNKVLAKHKILTIVKQSNEMDTEAWQQMIDKNLVSVTASDDPARSNDLEVINKTGIEAQIASAAFTEDLSSQVSGGPASTLTLSFAAASLSRVWIDGVLQYPPVGFLTLTTSLTITASEAIDTGKSITVEYVKV